MENNKTFSLNDVSLFRTSLKDIREIKQDTIFHYKSSYKKKSFFSKRKIFEYDLNSHLLSNSKLTHKVKYNPVSYVRNIRDENELKKMKKGKYIPEITLDLHGLNQLQAKKELGILISICLEENIFCACIIHGHGKNILKQQTSFWLSQHPDIIAFCQAPKGLGSKAALIVLIDSLI
ncbi:endonuclease SmrB [Buchnera aphidicola]|uniref:endonuclease SmrB n=1 Tax=Buchnera aphidicola TaxID=9 RepID=UPI0031B68DD3